MNAVQHGLTGHRMMLQEHEHKAYTRLTEALTLELNPATEPQRQLFRRSSTAYAPERVASVENNILNFGLIENLSDAPHDDPTECMAAQTRSWLANENSFEKLGRYEARLSRQLLAYTKELERLQQTRQPPRKQMLWPRRNSVTWPDVSKPTAARPLKPRRLTPNSPELIYFTNPTLKTSDFSIFTPLSGGERNLALAAEHLIARMHRGGIGRRAGFPGRLSR